MEGRKDVSARTLSHSSASDSNGDLRKTRIGRGGWSWEVGVAVGNRTQILLNNNQTQKNQTDIYR